MHLFWEKGVYQHGLTTIKLLYHVEIYVSQIVRKHWSRHCSGLATVIEIWVCRSAHWQLKRRWAADRDRGLLWPCELFLCTNLDVIVANIRRVPLKRSPIRLCQSEITKNDVDAETCCAADERACNCCFWTSWCIGGVRIIAVCFDIYREELKKIYTAPSSAARPWPHDGIQLFLVYSTW